MNPAMLSMLLPTVQKVFGSGKLDGLLGVWRFHSGAALR